MVTVYGKPACVQCNATNMKLQRLGIEYEYIDVSTNADALEYTKGLGYMSAPVVVTRNADGSMSDHWSGYQPDKLNALAA